METAENSILIERPLEETHRVWLEWVGEEPSSGTQGEVEEPMPEDELSKHDLRAKQGTIHFHDLGNGSTRTTIRLTVDPQAQRDADVYSGSVADRIDRYLRRFKHLVEA